MQITPKWVEQYNTTNKQNTEHINCKAISNFNRREPSYLNFNDFVMKSQTTDKSSEKGIKRILIFSRGGKEENKFKWLLFILSNTS